VHSTDQTPTLLSKNEKLQNPKNMADAFSNFVLTVTEKLNIKQVVKADATSFLKDAFPRN
jgi:hypothetical protein